MPKAAVDLPLPLPVWTMIRPFSSVLVAMILSRAAFFFAIFSAWRASSLPAAVRLHLIFVSSSMVSSIQSWRRAVIPLLGEAQSNRAEFDRGDQRPRSIASMQPVGHLVEARRGSSPR